MAIKVEISAENKQQGDDILNALLEKKLVTGGQFIQTPARFLWKGAVVDMDYCTITSFTLDKHKEAITEVVKAHSKEEVPMIAFLQFQGNRELTDWVEGTCSG